MDKELEQQAIATFVQQPEVYAEFLNNNGQDGSQIPVEEIKKDPDTYVQAFQKDKKFHDTIVGLFQEIVKSQQKSSMFREGGKFDYLNKLQKGGTSPEASFKVENRSTDKKAKRSARRNTRPVPDSGRATNRQVGAGVSDTGNQYVYEKALVGNPGFGTTTETYATITPQRDTILNQTFPTNSGIIERTYTTGMPEYDTVMDRLRKTGVFDALKFYNEGWRFQEGGKLSKENKINKKYIKDSEKAGQQASKKMSDLKNKHKAELKKIEKGQEGILINGNDSKLRQIKKTLIGPSFGQTTFGIKRPLLSRTVSYRPEGNDTTFVSKNIEGFDPTLNDNMTRIKYKYLDPKTKKKLNDIIDRNYEDWNTSVGSYPYNLYETTYSTKYKR